MQINITRNWTKVPDGSNDETVQLGALQGFIERQDEHNVCWYVTQSGSMVAVGTETSEDEARAAAEFEIKYSLIVG